MGTSMRLGDYLVPTTVDWPGKCAMIVWFAGCDFRCRYCQNASIVPLGSGRERPIAEIEEAIRENSLWIDGVVFSGGEPTLQEEALCQLSSYVRKRERGVLIDTNGSRPDVLAELISEGLVDRVSLDLKAAPARYPEVAGVSERIVERVLESYRVAAESDVFLEIRTTVVPGLVGINDIQAIAAVIGDCDVYYLQQFRPEGDLLDKSLSSLQPPTHRELTRLGRIAKKRVGNVGVKSKEMGVQYL